VNLHKRQLLQEEIDRKQAAAKTPNKLMDGTQIEDLEVDLNNLDQQRSEYQQLQSEADKKPAAKKTKSKEDGAKKMPAADHQRQTRS